MRSAACAMRCGAAGAARLGRAGARWAGVGDERRRAREERAHNDHHVLAEALQRGEQMRLVVCGAHSACRELEGGVACGLARTAPAGSVQTSCELPEKLMIGLRATATSPQEPRRAAAATHQVATPILTVVVVCDAAKFAPVTVIGTLPAVGQFDVADALELVQPETCAGGRFGEETGEQSRRDGGNRETEGQRERARKPARGAARTAVTMGAAG